MNSEKSCEYVVPRNCAARSRAFSWLASTATITYAIQRNPSSDRSSSAASSLIVAIERT